MKLPSNHSITNHMNIHFNVFKVWFLCLMAYQLFVGYLMPKPFSK